MCKAKGSAALVVAAAAMMMFLTGCETTKHAEVMSAEELAKQAQVSGAGDVGAPGAEEGGIPLRGPGVGEGEVSVGDVTGKDTGAPSEMPLTSLAPEGPPTPTLRVQEEIPLPASEVTPPGGPMVADVGVLGEGIPEGRAGGTTKSDITDEISQYPTGPRSPGAFFEPEGPPQAFLGDRPEPSSAVTTMADTPTGDAIVSSEGGPHGYEGEQFVRALTPSDFVPESPPAPSMGEAQPTTPSTMETAESKAGDEVVRLPDHSGTEDAMKPLDQGDLGVAAPNGRGMADGAGLGHVYFDFDQYFIREDAVSTLQANAQILNAKHQDSGVLIEGHCDERGTSEYNLVLGERRAQAVKNYLMDLGVSSSRIHIVSYGKERPSCTESEESCWQQNRRGHFVLQ